MKSGGPKAPPSIVLCPETLRARDQQHDCIINFTLVLSFTPHLAKGRQAVKSDACHFVGCRLFAMFTIRDSGILSSGDVCTTGSDGKLWTTFCPGN